MEVELVQIKQKKNNRTTETQNLIYKLVRHESIFFCLDIEG